MKIYRIRRGKNPYWWFITPIGKKEVKHAEASVHNPDTMEGLKLIFKIWISIQFSFLRGKK